MASDVRAGGAFVEFYSKGDAAVQGKLAQLQERMKSLGKTVTIMGALLAGSGASITAPFLHGLNVASETAGAIISASRRTGIGFAELQTLAYALKVDFDELAGATRKMNTFLDEAARGSAGANERLSELGLSINDLMRLSESDRLVRIADGMSRISDAAQRGAAQTHIFGRNAMGMDISGGAAGIQERQQRGARFSMSPADVELMGQFLRAQKELALATKALWSSIGAAAAGPMTEFVVIMTELILGAKKWVDENRPLLTTVFRIADAAVAAGAALTALGGIVIAGSYLVGIMGTAISFLVAASYYLSGAFLVGKVATWLWTAAVFAYNAAITVAHFLTWGWTLAIVAVAAAAGYAAVVWGASAVGILRNLSSITTGVRSAAGTIRTMFAGIAESGASAFDGIKDAIYGGELELAFSIAVAGLKVIWGELVVGFRLGWLQITEGFLNAWDKAAIWLAKKMIIVTVDIAKAFARVHFGIRTGWSEMVEWMALKLNAMLQRMEEMWIRAREAFNPFGSESRTDRLVGEANARGDQRAADIRSQGAADRGGINAELDAVLGRLAGRQAELLDALAGAGRTGQNPDQNPAVIAARRSLEEERRRLEALNLDAWIAAEQRRIQGFGGDADREIEHDHNFGTFSATAAAGFAGDPVDRLARLAEINRDQNERIIAALVNRTAAAMG
jgi:hypothetical protein